MVHLLDVRPCAVCRAYVPYDTGCEHWKPWKAAPGSSGAARRAERNREYKRRDREAAKAAKLAAVAEFRRQHGLPPLENGA
jgi:uncharacterized protein YkwD